MYDLPNRNSNYNRTVNTVSRKGGDASAHTEDTIHTTPTHIAKVGTYISITRKGEAGIECSGFCSREILKSKPINDSGKQYMDFFNSAVDVLQTLVIALGAGLGIWGAINLLEGYGNDNPGAKSQGMKQLMAGGGVALVGIALVPLLAGLFG